MTAPTRTPNPATTTRPGRSSKRVAHKKPLAILPWLLLGLLALLLAGIFLLINAVDDDGRAGPADDSLGQLNSRETEAPSSAGGDTPPAPAAAPGSAPTAAVPPAGPGNGQLKVGEQDLLALAGGSLTGTDSTSVTGSAQVQSVVSDEGFWVGENTTDRVFVYLTPEARQANGESGFTVKAGQSVQVTGQLEEVASASNETQGVTDGEGKDQLEKQGAFVSATSVSLND